MFDSTVAGSQASTRPMLVNEEFANGIAQPIQDAHQLQLAGSTLGQIIHSEVTLIFLVA